MVPSLSSPHLGDQKQALRRVMVARRDALGSDERVARCQAATDRLCAWPAFEPVATKIVSGFVAIRNEIDPGAALASARRAGAVIVLPRLTDEVPRMRFHRVNAHDSLVPGPHGLSQPAATAPEVAAEAIDLMLLPGLAFDLTGRRLGYGGGYYDEVAARLRDAGRGLLVGFAYDFQIVPTCPAGEHDVSVDWVITDQRTVACGGMA